MGVDYRIELLHKLDWFVRIFGIIGVVIGVLLVWPVHAGTVTGHILYYGVVAPAKPVTVTRDTDFCGETWVDQSLKVDADTKGLLGAIVSLESPAAPPTHQSSTEMIVVNKKCHFAPRVGVVQSGQFLHIGNADPVLHNTHVFQGRRTILNVALVPGSRVIKKRLRRPGFLLVKCDKHTFMRGHIAVFDHPFFAVTNEQGRFRITGLPEGTHTLTIWHEILGSRSAQVTIPPEGDVPFTFDYSTTSA